MPFLVFLLGVLNVLVELVSNDAHREALVAVQPQSNPVHVEMFMARSSRLSTITDETPDDPKWPISYWKQVKVLSARAMIYLRGEIFTVINFVQSIFLGLLVGMFYYRMPWTAGKVPDRIGNVRAKLLLLETLY